MLRYGICVGTIFILSLRIGIARADDAILSRLVQVWVMQRNALQSGEFMCLTIQHLVPSEHQIDRSRVRALFHQLESRPNSRSLTKVAASLVPSLKEVERPWSTDRYLIDGDSIRAEQKVPGNSDVGFTFIRHDNREILVTPRGKALTDQVQVFASGMAGIWTPRLTDFVFIPSERFLQQPTLKLSSSSIDNDLLTLSTERASVVADPDTGFVVEVHAGTYGVSSFREVLQAVPETYNGGLILPKIYLDCQYKGRQLDRFTIRLMEEAIPNKMLQPQEFQFAVAREAIIDRTGNTPVPLGTPGPISDVGTAVDEIKLARESSEIAQGPVEHNRWLLAVNILIFLLLLAIVYWKNHASHTT